MATNDSLVGDVVPSSTVIRPKPDGDSVGLTVLLGGGGIAMICVAVLVSGGSGHGHGSFTRIGLGLVGLVILFVPVLMIWQYRVVVTPETLVLRGLGRKPKTVVNHADIAKAQWKRRGRGYAGSFVDANGVVLLELAPFFLKKQVRQIAAMLDVPLKG